MSKSYNISLPFSSTFANFFSSLHPSMNKTQLNFIGDFFSALLSSNSVNFEDIAFSLLSIYPNNQLESLCKRISNFLNNPNYSYHTLFDKLIIYILSNYKVKHADNRVYISFDHMFVKDKYTTFMLSIKIGKQGFPLYFKLYDGKSKTNSNHGDAFKISNIKESLLYVHNLLKSIDPLINIVWLADRWFGNLFPLFNFIDKELHDSFVFRCKDNFKVLYHFKKEGHKIWCSIHDLPSFIYKSNFFEDLEFTFKKYKYNLTICKSDNHKERWFLISNINPKDAKKFYAYRFGGIETIFKNQKSNGFDIERTGMTKLHGFENMYSFICMATCYYICLGTDVTKNSNCYKKLGFRIVRNIKDYTVRVVSLFKTGLRLFQLTLKSTKYYRLPFTFKLYDI